MKKIKKVVSFVGTESAVLMVLSVPLGIVSMLMELGFALGLQSFLVVLKVTRPEALNLPNWLINKSDFFILGFLLGLSFLRSLLSGITTYLNSLVPDLFSSLQRKRLISWIFFSKSVSSGWVTTLFGQEVSNACLAITSIQAMALQGTLLLGLAIGLAFLSVKVTLISFCLLPMLAIVLKVFDRNLRQNSELMQKEWHAISRRMYLGIKNLLMLRICGVEKHEHDLAQGHFDKYLKYLFHVLKITSFLGAFPQFIGIFVVIFLTLISNRYGWLTGGATLTYFYLLMRFVQNASSITVAVTGYSRNAVSLNTVAKWWAEYSHDSDRGQKKYFKDEKVVSFKNEPFSWRVDQIDFRYGEIHPLLFEKFSLNVPAGSVLVIKGVSGSGKSTLLGLLLDELDPTDGTVFIRQGNDEYPMKVVKRSVLKRIGYVGPESFLIDGTIKENLLYGLMNEVPSDLEIELALKKAGCDFAFELPDGISHILSEQGQGLSAGQKQRIALARALLRKPLALILDEATSNLDLDTEAAILETLKNLKGEITQIIVTHRETALRLADQVLSFPIKANEN